MTPLRQITGRRAIIVTGQNPYTSDGHTVTVQIERVTLCAL
jgi:hypothetical protein